MTDLVRFLGALAVLIALAALARQVARWVHQPAVLGELVLGILLGPTLLAWAWPGAHAFLFSGGNAPILDALAWVGLLLFMLVAGAEMHWSPRDALPAVGIASGGLVGAAGLGVVIALARPDWFFAQGPTPGGILLVAVLFTVTALPVLARILADLGLQSSRTAGMALGSATIDDVIGWSALGIAAATAHDPITSHLAIDLLLVAAVLAGAFALDRLLTPLLARRITLEPSHLFVAVLVATFTAALLTHAAGLHAVVGALAVGAIVSRHPRLREEVTTRFRGVAAVVLLPLFFVLTVGDADLRRIANVGGIVALAVTMLAMSVGKVGGAYVGARVAGIARAQALGTGLAVNARGAVGLVVAKVGLDAGLLSDDGFAVVVLAIVATTLLAAPLMAWHVRRVGQASL